jgi:hypothetical protein
MRGSYFLSRYGEPEFVTGRLGKQILIFRMALPVAGLDKAIIRIIPSFDLSRIHMKATVEWESGASNTRKSPGAETSR